MILIKNTTIVTQDKERKIIKDGALVIEKDKIQAIGKTKSIEKEYDQLARKVIDGKGKVVLPGLINSHGHLSMTLLRGYADDLSLDEWWPKHIYPMESKFGEDHVYWGSMLAMVEMIKSGTTCFTDFYYYEDKVAKAASEVGIRGMLGLAVLDVPTFQFKNSSEALEIGKSALEKFKNHDLVKVSLAPHMFQTTSLKSYQKSKELTDYYGAVLSTHAAETKQEVDYCIKKYKKRPIEILSKAGLLDKNTLLAHCCWLTKKEIKILSQTNASVAHCPVSNMKLASGMMPFQEMDKINVSLGTDSACSNNNLDMFEEMKTAALIHKSHLLDPTVANAQEILDMATLNGAKALGLGQEIGSLEPGKKADLIMVDFEKPHLTPCYDIVSHLVYSVKGSDVSTVIINGKIIMEKRKIKGVDQSKILDKVKRLAISLAN